MMRGFRAAELGDVSQPGFALCANPDNGGIKRRMSVMADFTFTSIGFFRSNDTLPTQEVRSNLVNS